MGSEFLCEEGQNRKLLPSVLLTQAQFGMCSSANPVVLLRLFPSIAPDTLLSPVLHLFPGALCHSCMVQPKLLLNGVKDKV